MSTLNLFPARVPIGYADSNGQVLMTPEFFRALTDLLQRVGGPTAPDTEDIDITANIAQAPIVDFSPFMDAVLAQQGGDSSAALAEARKDIDGLQAQIAQLVAIVSEVKKQADSLEVVAGYRDQFRVDWERPGPLGSLTPNTAIVTSLTSNSFVTAVGNVNAGGNLNAGNGTTNVGALIRGANSGAAGGASVVVQNGATSIIAIGNKSAVNGGAYDATPFIFGNAQIEINQGIKVLGGAQVITTSTALTNGAGAGAGTITNAPAAGNPTKWIGINDNGTVRYVPAW